ncbi:phospholipid-binding protein MlaC [Acidobacteriota bacterium]
MKRINSGIIILLVSASLLNSQTPLEVIKDSNQKILDIYASHQDISRKMEEEIFQIMDSVTDFNQISLRTIERFCRKMSEKECGEFDRVFQELLRVSSIKKVGRYRAESFDYLGEEIEGNSALVRTIAHYENDTYELDYHLELFDGLWKIVNYTADGVDTIRNYRKQFQRILRKEPLTQLLTRLENKIQEFRNEESE